MMSSGEGQFAFWLAVGAMGVGFWVAVYPLITAYAKRISGGVDDAALKALEARLAALEARSPVTGEVDLQHQRIAELEERVEFAERMLARSPEPASLRRGDG